jgi:hypothetical protein
MSEGPSKTSQQNRGNAARDRRNIGNIPFQSQLTITDADTAAGRQDMQMR